MFARRMCTCEREPGEGRGGVAGGDRGRPRGGALRRTTGGCVGAGETYILRYSALRKYLWSRASFRVGYESINRKSTGPSPARLQMNTDKTPNQKPAWRTSSSNSSGPTILMNRHAHASSSSSHHRRRQKEHASIPESLGVSHCIPPLLLLGQPW